MARKVVLLSDALTMGEEARLDNKPRSHNPFRRWGEQMRHEFWNRGWDGEDDRQRRLAFIKRYNPGD
jgi:hypothetical protein